MGEKHPDYANSLNNLAWLYAAQGNYAKAEPLYIEALAIHKQVLGEKHPDYANSLNNLACCEIGLRSFGAAAGHAQQAAEIMRQHLEQTAAIQSEHQQLLMIDNVRYAFSIFLSASRAAKTPPEVVYDEVLAWKGAVTSRQAFFKALRHALAKNPQAAALYGELEAATSELAVLTNQVPTGPERDIYKKRLDDLSEQVEDLQGKLAKVSAQFAEQRAQQKRTGAELRQALPADTALVDLIEYDNFGWTEENQDKPISATARRGLRRAARSTGGVDRSGPERRHRLGRRDVAEGLWPRQGIAAGGRDAAAKSLATAGSQFGRRKHRLDLSRRRIGQVPLDRPAGQ